MLNKNFAFKIKGFKTKGVGMKALRAICYFENFFSSIFGGF
jgi:hypothetical protein